MKDIHTQRQHGDLIGLLCPFKKESRLNKIKIKSSNSRLQYLMGKVSRFSAEYSDRWGRRWWWMVETRFMGRWRNTM
jgi:hypothetical protein